jgi:hypothetical protein
LFHFMPHDRNRTLSLVGDPVDHEPDHPEGSGDEQQQKSANQHIRQLFLLRVRLGYPKNGDKRFGNVGENLHWMGLLRSF